MSPANSLDEACGIQGFMTPTIPCSATLHTGYVSKLPVTNKKPPPAKYLIENKIINP